MAKIFISIGWSQLGKCGKLGPACVHDRVMRSKSYDVIAPKDGAPGTTMAWTARTRRFDTTVFQQCHKTSQVGNRGLQVGRVIEMLGHDARQVIVHSETLSTPDRTRLKTLSDTLVHT